MNLYICFFFNYKNENNLIMLPKRPKISIFLPIYNKEHYLQRSIGSLQNQTLKNIEIVAVNDASTDNTLKVLKKLSKKDKRIKIINTDRNHGLLYSRAIGILNSTGEYLMNLDPDDKLIDNENLEDLYNKTYNNQVDLIIFLIKRICTNETNTKEKYLTNLENKLQLQKEDYRITNKLIKRNIILRAYKYYSRNIYSNKWNYHEDNIWNFLVRKFSKKIEIFNNYVYLYKRNDESLNMGIGSIIDIKNRIYRIKLFIKLYKIFNLNLYYKLYQYLDYIILSSNSSLLNNDYEIKKGLTNISVTLLNIFKKNRVISKTINNNLIKISNNKVILFINKWNISAKNYLSNIFIYNYFQHKTKKIITIDINNSTQFKNIFNYIFSNDILVGMDNIMNLQNFKNILDHYYNNKIIIFNKKNMNINKYFNNSKKIIFCSFLNNFTNRFICYKKTDNDYNTIN